MDLSQIAKQIKDASENIFLIYAFNSTGKTRLSVEYKETARNTDGRQTGVYYNAFSAIMLLVKICLFGTMNTRSWISFPAV